MKKTVTAVLARHIEFGFESLFDGEKAEYIPQSYVVISEPLEIDFQLLPETDLTEKRVAIIDKEISKVRANLEVLEQSKQEILSLPAPEGE